MTNFGSDMNNDDVNTFKNVNEEKDYVENEVNNFDELEISEDLLRGIYSMGFEYPSAIQRKAIPNMLLSDDLIAQAQSGTGKTATFLIDLLIKSILRLKPLKY